MNELLEQRDDCNKNVFMFISVRMYYVVIVIASYKVLLPLATSIPFFLSVSFRIAWCSGWKPWPFNSTFSALYLVAVDSKQLRGSPYWELAHNSVN